MDRIIEFTGDTAPWIIIDDGVMGGCSRGSWCVEGGKGVFSGDLSLENNGGFSSVRSSPISAISTAVTGVRTRVRGDGRGYQIRIRPDRNFDGVSYRAKFETRADEWQVINLDLTQFEAVYRGAVLNDYPALTGDRLTTVGFLLADKRSGSFRLEVDWFALRLADSKVANPAG
jgi:monofunctional biosynthetic peptidoglycan transglycosylase